MPAPLRRLRAVARALAKAVRYQRLSQWRRRPVLADVVLYESFAGNGALCNPEALFRELLRSADQADLTHIWALDSRKRNRALIHEFADDDRVRFVRYRSAAYFRALCTSRFLINNATFPPEFGKRDGQVYLNTWHGTPLKSMGYDMPGGALDSANTLRNFTSADFLLSQNPFMTERMYADAYRLRGVFRGTVIEEGYPRLDRQLLDREQALEARDRLERLGMELRDRSIVLYAPTWRGTSFSSPEDDAAELLNHATALQHALGERFILLLKTHQVVHRFAAGIPALRRMLVPNDIPTNVILGLSDFLVTDYSSIFFDFLATGRPILFFTPDAAEYTGSRGTYFSQEELPGPVSDDVADIAEAIRESGIDAPLEKHPRYAEWRKRFVTAEVGTSSRRVVDVVFRGRRDGYRLVELEERGKASMLIHLGGLRSNGITSSALNLLTQLDHERFDVSVTYARPRSAQQRSNQERIDPRVRQFPRLGGMNGSKIEHLRRRMSERRDRVSVHRDSAAQSRLWDDEWRRCFGDSRFDAVVDFSGYSAFWAILLLHSPAARRSVWLHNDMASEVHRVIGGRQRMRHTLPAVFGLYPEFDAIVSVSPSLSDLNRSRLSDGRNDRFVSARNPIDAEHVIAGAALPLRSLPEFVGEDGAPGVPAWIDSLEDDDGTFWFISVGRLSTEKNQARLLSAFAKVHSLHQNTRLLLIGYGPLREELDNLIAAAGLRDSAIITGPYATPFAFMAAADGFVLSSDYEGQPMVLLEAAVLAMPIVSTAFDSVNDALDGDTILVVEHDDDALADGMLTLASGAVTRSSIDVDDYNRRAVAEFLSATQPAPVRRMPAR